jgi:hypothetical protein
MKLLALVLCASGCFFDKGFSTVPRGSVDPQTLCVAASGACPRCSSPDGTGCRDAWYPSALRCSDASQCPASASCQRGYCVRTDADGDGLDDDFEREIAELNFPKVYLATSEPCGTPRGVIYRARRHPQNPSRVAVTYIVLYGVDCGTLNGHLGDAESFAITVDLDVEPGAPATVGIEAWAHAGTVCASTSSCDAQAGTSACGFADGDGGVGEMIVYASAAKHASYLSSSTCIDNCFDSCNMGDRISGPLLNVGEPDHPMVTDLTTQGFVQAADGWDAKLLHFNPWSALEFAGGGRLDVPLGSNLAPPGQ